MRYTEGLPPWDRVFAEEWAMLGIAIPAPSKNARMVISQRQRVGYSFAACDVAYLHHLINCRDRPTFSGVYGDDLFVTAIPIDWDMPVDKVMGTTWCPEDWLTRIHRVPDAALCRLLSSLDVFTRGGQILEAFARVSEEMMQIAYPTKVYPSQV